MRAIALDVGDRYIGVASQDHTDAIAYRYATLDRKQQNVLKDLQDIITNESIDTVIVGVPYHVEDGSETEQTRKTRVFIESLKTHLSPSIAITEVDETLTSRQARELLQGEGVDMSQEHAEAARIMLQEFITHGTT